MPEVQAPAEPIVTRHDLLVAGLRGLLVAALPLLGALLVDAGWLTCAVFALFSVVPGALAEGRAARRRPRGSRQVLAGARDVLVVAGPFAAFGVVQAAYCAQAIAVGPAQAWSALADQPGLLLLASLWGMVVAIAAGAAAVIRLEAATPPERLDGGWIWVCLLSSLAGWPLLFIHTLADLFEAGLYVVAPSLRPEAA
jgi:hypothetical protein